MHRPYHRMPETSFAMSYLFALAQDGTRGLAELERALRASECRLSATWSPRCAPKPDILQFVRDGNIDTDAYPLTIQLRKEFRSSDEFEALVAAKMSLGSEAMKDIGNVYCAALPAWMAAGLEDAHARGIDLAGGKVLAVGYGSGDAAEAIPMTVAPGWRRRRRRRSASRQALEPYQDLTQTQYENLHDTGSARGLEEPEDGFVIQSIGSSANPNFSDEGIEYYRLVR